MNIKELIKTLNKIENQNLEIRLYDDELDSYINFDGDCIEVHEHGCDFNFYKEDRQDDKMKTKLHIDDMNCFLNFLQSENVIKINSLENLQDILDKFEDLTGEV